MIVLMLPAATSIEKSTTTGSSVEPTESLSIERIGSATGLPIGFGLAEIGFQNARIAADQAGRSVGDLGALLQHDDPAAQRHDEVDVMLDDQQRHALGIELAYHVLDAPHHGRVDAGHGLVQHDETRP